MCADLMGDWPAWTVGPVKEVGEVPHPECGDARAFVEHGLFAGNDRGPQVGMHEGGQNREDQGDEKD